jgi:hypothetical protein
MANRLVLLGSFRGQIAPYAIGMPSASSHTVPFLSRLAKARLLNSEELATITAGKKAFAWSMMHQF